LDTQQLSGRFAPWFKVILVGLHNNFLDFCKYFDKILIGGEETIFKLKK